jgi:hypothetical protein
METLHAGTMDRGFTVFTRRLEIYLNLMWVSNKLKTIRMQGCRLMEYRTQGQNCKRVCIFLLRCALLLLSSDNVK